MLRFISTTANTNIEEFVFNTLRSFIFARIIFHGCKFCHIWRGFIFADDEILIILGGQKSEFLQLPNMYQLNQYNSPLFIIQKDKNQIFF